MGTIFGRTIVKIALRVIPESARDRVYEGTKTRIARFVARQIDHVADAIDYQAHPRPTAEEAKSWRYRR
ncbi:hypothetical protein SEA_GIRLPOWER_49 [Streptomyces phage GirlPower]|nr:hypothetical protein SEA_GIRLPOWER_49 [Streptomyces phage GirlPower]